jgi:hypothetical protein
MRSRGVRPLAGCGAEPHDLDLRRRRKQSREAEGSLPELSWNGAKLRRLGT